MLILCALCVSLSLWVVNEAESTHADETYKQIYAIKKSFLKDVVHNAMRDLDKLREHFRSYATDQIQIVFGFLDGEHKRTTDAFPEGLLRLLKQPEISKTLLIRLEDKQGVVLFTNMASSPAAADKTLMQHRRTDAWHLAVGVNEPYVDAQAKAAMRSYLHNKTFENEAYLWVNEIKNFSGGDNYAIRKIHPNLINTEGMLLSTKLKDVKGNTPYQTELDGINKDGEVFSTYWFKRKNSDEIAEKLTYASLYRDFNWVFAMGIHLDDVQSFINAAEKSSRKLVAKVVSISLISTVLLFGLVALMLALLEKWYIKRTELDLREESNKDPLTGAFNRRIGDIYLAEAFKRFKKGLNNPALMFFDIDDFKKVNDKWGHEFGDKVLKRVVEQTQRTMRSGDNLFRWGGEEFLLIADGVTPESALFLTTKLNGAILQQSVQVEGIGGNETYVNVSVSIGVSWFDKADEKFEESLRRADHALYRAKAEGKNCARLGFFDGANT